MRKDSYVVHGNQESFIVPLLAKEISRALSDIALDIHKNNCGKVGVALDCGCGNQPFKNKILEQGFQYESLDVTQNSFNNVDHLCSLDSSPRQFNSVIDKTYCLVLATEVLEHVSDWHAAFANIASIMEPGGYALLTAPFFYPLHEEPHDFCRPTVHQFREVSRSAGLDVVSISKVGDAVDVIGTLLGAARITYSLRGGPSIFSKIANRFLLKFQEAVFELLVKYRDRLDSDSNSVYLSNVVVLKKAFSC
jgi:SAM-dependent methyltransferase